VLMQVHDLNIRGAIPAADSAGPAALTVARQIVKQEGIWALWRGNSAMVLHAVPTSGIIFAVTSASKRALERAAPLAGSPSSQSLLAATVGAFCGIASAHPLDVVKTRLLAQSYAAGSTPYYRGPVRALQQIGVDEGFRGLYRGLGVALSSSVPAITLNFALFDLFRKALQSPSITAISGDTSGWQSLAAGAAAGASTSVLLYPLDLVKRRVQFGGDRSNAVAQVGTAMEAARETFRTGAARWPRHRLLGGIRELYRGLCPEVLKVAPSMAVMFAVNERLLALSWWPLE